MAEISTRDSIIAQLHEEFGVNWKDVVKKILQCIDETWEAHTGLALSSWKALWAYLSIDGFTWRQGSAAKGVIKNAEIGARWASAIVDILIQDESGDVGIRTELEALGGLAFGGKSLTEYVDSLRIGSDKSESDHPSEEPVLVLHRYANPLPLKDDTKRRYDAAARCVYQILKDGIVDDNFEVVGKHQFADNHIGSAVIALVGGTTSEVKSRAVLSGIWVSDFEVGRSILRNLGLLHYSGHKSDNSSQYRLVVESSVPVIPSAPTPDDRKLLRSFAQQMEERRNSDQVQSDDEAQLDELKREEARLQLQLAPILEQKRTIEEQLRTLRERMSVLKLEQISKLLQANEREHEELKAQLEALRGK